MECIVLAGGLGTRLRNTIGDLPKCMAGVNGKPFLQYLLEYLQSQEITRVILSLGHKHEIITEWLRGRNFSFEIASVIENEPMGTGGGIQLALKAAREENVFVVNGDTMFEADLARQLGVHLSHKAETTLALKPMEQFSRYGAVIIDDQAAILSFEEKRHCETGLINGGVYLIDRRKFLERNLPLRFSFETDYLGQYVSEHKFFGFVSDSYFIDIGVPEDYQKVQADFKTRAL
jgi:D-glycero-alpha-D-manno-heptose 1-phosphate guanylyltransferase